MQVVAIAKGTVGGDMPSVPKNSSCHIIQVDSREQVSMGIKRECPWIRAKESQPQEKPNETLVLLTVT